MYTVSLFGKHHMLFVREPTLTLAKERANEEFKNSVYDPWGRYLYARIYDPETQQTYRKNGLDGEWELVTE